MALARCALINVPPCIALVLNKGPTRVFHVLTCCTPPQSTNREMDGTHHLPQRVSLPVASPSGPGPSLACQPLVHPHRNYIS